MSTIANETVLEDLAETIYDEIVKANFKDLDPSEELLVYEIACDRALAQFPQGQCPYFFMIDLYDFLTPDELETMTQIMLEATARNGIILDTWEPIIKVQTT